MTWSYNVAALATTPLFQVRRLIGDVKTGDQLIQDEEINWELTQWPNIYLAAAASARAIAAQFSREVDIVQGELKTNYSNKAKAFEALAQRMDVIGGARSGGALYAGGISQADKASNVLDTDRTPPAFNRGEFDNYLPESPVGQQTPDASPSQPEPPPT